MKLILVRHGNTFESHETPVWVGARNDLELTAKGREQGASFSKWLCANEHAVTQVYCGPLKRTKVFADIVGAEVGLKPIVDSRLAEIDFGTWSGKSDSEIVSLYGETALISWREHGTWPDGMGWQPREQSVQNEVREFVSSLRSTYGPDDTVVAVTSNGRLRYFLGLDSEAFAHHKTNGGISVKTGNYCVLDISSLGVSVKSWNLKPDTK